MSKSVFIAFKDRPDREKNEFGGVVYETRFIGVGKTLENAVELLDFDHWESWNDAESRLEVTPEATSPELLKRVMRRHEDEDTREVGFVQNRGRHSEYKIVWYAEYVATFSSSDVRTYKFYVIEEPVRGKKGINKLRREMWPHDPYGEGK